MYSVSIMTVCLNRNPQGQSAHRSLPCSAGNSSPQSNVAPILNDPVTLRQKMLSTEQLPTTGQSDNRRSQSRSSWWGQWRTQSAENNYLSNSKMCTKEPLEKSSCLKLLPHSRQKLDGKCKLDEKFPRQFKDLSTEKLWLNPRTTRESEQPTLALMPGLLMCPSGEAKDRVCVCVCDTSE